MRTYAQAQPAVERLDLATLRPFLLSLMLRNVATDGFRIADPADPARFSNPGCIIASPSFDKNQAGVTQDYVFHWTRDASIAALELAAVGGFGDPAALLADHVAFAARCHRSVGVTDTRSVGGLAQACFTVEGEPRAGWVLQNDGPALQAIALLRAFDLLDTPTQELARGLIAADAAFILTSYGNAGYNLWEEVSGLSFFTRSVQLRCLQELRARPIGLRLDGIDGAVDALRAALDSHWDEQAGHYLSIVQPANPRPGYDPNIDIVSACIYGAVPPDDPRLLATTAQLRRQWTDAAGSSVAYPINAADAALGLGPLFGRYPGDLYDGDTNSSGTDHPWALCTANVAELYYRLAVSVAGSGRVGHTPQTAQFFEQVGVGADTSPGEASRLLRAAGDAMLKAVVYHSDHLELSEQFDARTGFVRSVRNLTWSYASVLSALRARGDTSA